MGQGKKAVTIISMGGIKLQSYLLKLESCNFEIKFLCARSVEYRVKETREERSN